MKVARTQVAAAIAERTLDITDSTELAREIAAYLLSENREHELEPLLRDVLTYRESKGIVEATLVTAHEMDAAVTEEVADLVRQHHPAAKTIIVRNAVHSSVIGGLKLQLAHEQLDMSVRAKLDTFKRLTTEGNA